MHNVEPPERTILLNKDFLRSRSVRLIESTMTYLVSGLSPLRDFRKHVSSYLMNPRILVSHQLRIKQDFRSQESFRPELGVSYLSRTVMTRAAHLNDLTIRQAKFFPSSSIIFLFFGGVERDVACLFFDIPYNLFFC